MRDYVNYVPVCTFRLRIEGKGQTILDTIINAMDGEDVSRAKRSIQRLLNEYTPVVQAAVTGGTDRESRAVSQNAPRTEWAERAASGKDVHMEDPAPAAEEPDADNPPASPPPSFSTAVNKPEGVKGSLQLCCSACGNIFGTFLHKYQNCLTCKCGCSIDLTVPLARYRFNCPVCGLFSYGKTNLEDPDITVRCRCKESVRLRWVSEAREYQN